MSFLQITDTFTKVAQQYAMDTDIAARYIEDNNISTYFIQNGINVDAREFLPLVTMMGVEGNTREEREADIHSKIEYLKEVFSDKDTSKREKYLNMIYDLLDTFDPMTADMGDEKQVNQLLQCFLLDQAFATYRIQNPEYFNNRYPTKEQAAVVQARAQFLTAAGAFVNKNLHSVGHPVSSLVTLPKVDKSAPQSVLDVRLRLSVMQRDEVLAANGAEVNSPVINLPVMDEMMPLAGMRVEDAAEFGAQFERYKDFDKHFQHYTKDLDMLEYYFSYVFAENLLNSESKNKQGFKEAGLKNFIDPLYIDGMPYVDFLKKHLPGVKPTDPVNARVIAICLLNGQHKVDVVNAYRDNNGKMQYEAKTVNPVLTEHQQEMKQEADAMKNVAAEYKRQADKEYLMQYSWFRRTFFNWGPFRILPKEEAPSQKTDEERHTDICKNMKKRMETKLAEVEKVAQADRLEKEKTERLAAQFKQEEDRLYNSVEQWDKDSVLGILGEQIKGSYHTINGGIRVAADKRYDNVAQILAKQVLYSQLCLERAEKKGAMGPIEQSLMGDGSKETIENNIKSVVQNIAGQEALRDAFFKKVAVDGVLNTEKYKEYVRNGGCKNLTTDYMKLKAKYDKKKPASDKVKEMPAPNKETEGIKK